MLWGGDELTFVMPAWLGLEFAGKFFEWVEDWTAPSGAPLTFGAGLVFCHEKTPIRQARKMAELLAEDGKETLDDPRNILQIEAFESVAMPECEGGLKAYRDAMYRFEGSAPDDWRKQRAKWLTFVFEKGVSAFSRLREVKSGEDGLPRAQLYRLLRLADKKQKNGFYPALGFDDDTLRDEAREYFRRIGVKDKDKREARVNALIVLAGAAPLAYSLAVVSHLWDYLDPLTEVEAGVTEAAA